MLTVVLYFKLLYHNFNLIETYFVVSLRFKQLTTGFMLQIIGAVVSLSVKDLWSLKFIFKSCFTTIF